MAKYFTYIFNPAKYSELSSKMSAKFVVGLYLATVIFTTVVSFIASFLVEDQSAYTGTDQTTLFVVSLVFGFIGITIGLLVTVLMYLLLSFLSAKLISSTTEVPTVRELARIYVFSNIPNIFFSIVVTLGSLVLIPLAYMNGGDAISSMVSLLAGCFAILIMFWSAYLIVFSIRSKYVTTTTNALLAGCLPTIGIYLAISLCAFVCFLCFGTMIAASLSESGFV